MATPLAVKRMAKFLNTRYASHIDVVDLSGREEQERERAILSRALSAHVLNRLAGLDPEAAGQHVTDAFDDHGIDGFYYNRPSKMVYVVQSKWSDSGHKAINETDATKTLKGLRRLLEVDLDGANTKLLRFKADCEEAANDSDTRYTVVFASTAAQALNDPARKYCTREIDKIAGVSGLVLLEEFARSRLYATLASASDPEKICLVVELEEWAEIQHPIIAYYGRVPLASILDWQQHGKDLFHRNLRGYLADPDLMESQRDTLTSAPEHFWYFNNGATLLCDKIKKRPLHGDSRRRGLFDCCGVSVVNGAQTIGILWEFAGDGSTIDPQARLPVRLISLEGASPEFAAEVTVALNTQRRIEPSDFVALDPLQQALQRDMAMDGRRYVVRPSDETGADNEFTFQEAATALACASGDLPLAVMAKRVVSKLWENTKSEPYTKIFPRNIDAETVWRAMVLQRAILKEIAQVRETANPKRRTILSHGNRFIEYKVFRSPALRGYADPAQKMSELESTATVIAEQVAKRLCDLLTESWREEAVQYIFKYPKKCKQLEDALDTGHQQLPTASQKQLFS